MKFYKITFYVIILIILIFLLYTLYNYIKNKVEKIEPFYDDFNSEAGREIKWVGTFYDIVETYNYSDMKYYWFSMPYYNKKVTIDENGFLDIPDSYFENNDRKEQTSGYNFELVNANGIFGKYIDATNTDSTINYTGAAIILARPNIHRINLKNFILTNGNTPNNFKLSDTDIVTLKDTYNVLYKINFWHSALKSGFYDNLIIAEKLDSKVTGFDYVKYIYNPNRYNDAIDEDQYYYNYVSSYMEFVKDKLDYDYYSLNNNMRLINDIYNGDIKELNLEYVNDMYPYEMYRILSPDDGESSDYIPKYYQTYLEKLNTVEGYDFKINVNAASKIIMENYIATPSVRTPGVSEPEPDYNKIFEKTSFQSSVNPGASNDMNGIKSGLTDFFNNFYILNAIYALYAERYYYVDSNYYNLLDASKSTLSFKDGNFIGGETFTTKYNDWLTTIGIQTTDPKAKTSTYINSDETEFIGSGTGGFSLYYYNISPYEDNQLKKKSYEDSNNKIVEYVDPIIPISKLYRGLRYVDAINIIDENRLKTELTDERIADKKKVDDYNNTIDKDINNTKIKIKNIKFNMEVREQMIYFRYDHFVRDIDYYTDNVDNTKPNQAYDPYTANITVTDDSDKGTDLMFKEKVISISTAMLNTFWRLTKYSSRDKEGDRGFENKATQNSIALENQRKSFKTITKNCEYQYTQTGTLRTYDYTKPKICTYSDTYTPLWHWMGLGTGKETETWTKQSLKDVAAELFKQTSGLAYDVQWYNDVIRYGLSDAVAENIGRNFTAGNQSYKTKYNQQFINWAKEQVALTNAKDFYDWRYYFKYPLEDPNAGGIKNVKEPLLSALLETERGNLKTLQAKTKLSYDKNLTIKIKYKTAIEKYNNLYSRFIPSLLKTTIEKLNNSIKKINSFNGFMNNFTDLIIHNYKWEEITRTKSINKILDVNYGKSINKKYPDFTVNIFKNVVRNKVESENKVDEDTYNVVAIETLMPALIYIEYYKGTLNTPSSSNDVYNYDDNDFLIYLKKKDNKGILKMVQEVVKSDLIILKVEIKDLFSNMYKELETSIKNSKINDAKVIMTNIKTVIENSGKEFGSKNKGPDMLSVLTTFLNTVEDNKTKTWKSYWTESLETLFQELVQKGLIIYYYEENGLFKVNQSDSSEKLRKYLALEDNFNDGKTMNDRVNKMYESYYFSKKTDFYFKKAADMYSDIYRHPKILMTYSNINSDGKTKSGFSIFDLGIILRYIFDYDIREYVDGTEKYTNYNFPTLFQYDSNNVISIKSNTNVLSDENYKNLSINSKLNNFFDIIDKQYNAFNKAFSEVNVPVDYFNFSQSETLLRKELDDILDKLSSNQNNPIDIIKYSYTTYFISSVNCLCTMYTDDVCNIILPLYKHLNYTFTELIEKVYNFNLPEFQIIRTKIINQTFLQDDKFKNFYEIYRTKFKSLNNGNITQSTSPGVSQSSPGEDQTDNKSGTLIYLFNVHNFLLNLILRTFYYYNKYTEYKKNELYGTYILNEFKESFEQTVDDDESKFKQDNPYLVNYCNIFTDTAYTNSVIPFLIDALTLYRTKIIKCCYNHILVNVANIVYQLNSKSIYIYNSENDDEYSQIEKGERLIKTMKLYENMLTTIKNGENYINNVSVTLQIGNNLPGGKRDDTLDEVFENLKGMFNKYLNTVFYIGNSKLYGCFDGNISKYYSSLGFSEFIDSKGNRKQGKESTLISYVNNKDTNGNDTKYGAIINCVNDTLAHNELITTDTTPGTTTKNKSELYDLVSIVPYSIAGLSKGATIDTYSCYAGKSSKFEAKDVPKPTIPLSDMDKCSVKYLDPDGNKNKDFDQNITSNTVIYKIDVSNKNDSAEVSFLGCFKKSIPDMGIYNTLPNFIGNISGSSYNNPSDLMKIIKNLVTNYNGSFGTNYDIYGITTNLEDTLQLDVYAGESSVDAKYAQYSKNDGYQENCNIFYPGSENYMIYQDKEKGIDPCLTNEVNHVKNYTELLTEYLNKNIKTQQETITEMGVDINLLKNLFPIKFSISEISNSKDNASLSVDVSNSIGFDPNNDSIRTCALSLLVKEGPQGIKGDVGALGAKGRNVKGLPGDIGNAGYWGESKN